jgi:hypothetical protein
MIRYGHYRVGNVRTSLNQFSTAHALINYFSKFRPNIVLQSAGSSVPSCVSIRTLKKKIHFCEEFLLLKSVHVQIG